MLKFEEWQKLSLSERCQRYKEMDDHDRFMARISQNITPVNSREKNTTENENNDSLNNDKGGRIR